LVDKEFFGLIDFTRNLFTPASPAQVIAARQRVDPSLVSINGKILSERELKHVLEDEDGDTLAVLKRMNSLKMLRNDLGPEEFARDITGIFEANIQRGQMGLTRRV
jgi:flavine halogenase